MPFTQEFLVAGGMTFPNGFVTTPICCPSRTSTLSGRYGHNLAEQKNQDWCGAFTGTAIENATWNTALHDAGYQTGFSGKYHNAPPRGFVPKGWDDFFSLFNECQYYNNSFNDNGRTVNFGDKPTDYMTSVIGNRSLSFLRNVSASAPFFMYIAPHSSHMPATPASWYVDAPLPSTKVARTPAYNTSGEGKHWVIAELPPLTPKFEVAIDEIFATRHRCLLSVDDILRDVVAELKAQNRLENTIFIYSSDHGYNLGTFRLSVEKFHFLENDIRVPFLVRGPGIPAGSTSPALVANIDIGATILELAGVAPAARPGADGQSFASALRGSGATSSAAQRDRLVIEYGSWGTGYIPRGPCAVGCGICGPELTQLVDAPSNTYTGMRIINSTANIAYAEFRENSHAMEAPISTNWTELYDLSVDPYQLVNLALQADKKDLVAQLSRELWSVANCTGGDCP
jgi:N-acetylglucosamine-6-sulfatase